MSAETHSNSDGIACPRCGARINDLYDVGGGGDGDFEIECCACDGEVAISRRTLISYTAKTGGAS